MTLHLGGYARSYTFRPAHRDRMRKWLVTTLLTYVLYAVGKLPADMRHG